MTDQPIQKIFQTRDQAVKKQDRGVFLSTQVAEIERGGSAGYLGVGSLRSEVLQIYDESELEKVVFVKETYSTDKDPYDAFVVYHLVNTTEGWKIYKMK